MSTHQVDAEILRFTTIDELEASIQERLSQMDGWRVHGAPILDSKVGLYAQLMVREEVLGEDETPVFPVELIENRESISLDHSYALTNMENALDFYDKVMAASPENRIAVGQDHWDWLLKASRELVRGLRHE